MSPIGYSKTRVVLTIVSLLVVWQTLRCLPWFQSLEAANVDHGPSSSGNITPVKVSVYYEALCPDSKNFVTKQLLPTMDKASRLVTVNLIPYGKAKTEDRSGNISFLCQHGPLECLGNKIHACAIARIPDEVLQVKYISCMIKDNMNPEHIGQLCANLLSIDWSPIQECSSSNEGNLLLKQHGIATHALRPRVSFIPTVVLDGKQGNQPLILKNLMKEVCNMFSTPPVECAFQEKSSRS